MFRFWWGCKGIKRLARFSLAVFEIAHYMNVRLNRRTSSTSTFVLLAHDVSGGQDVCAAVAKWEGKACKTSSAVQLRPAAPNSVGL
jgi:hypothetical protein